jgi:hypothetical protein
MGELSGYGEEVLMTEPFTSDDNFNTDVDGVKADAGYREEKGVKVPVFKVTKDEFFQNSYDGRRRMRFSTDSAVSQYMRGTRYRNPFFITTEIDGKSYTKKIK